ncbi:glycosyltransferase [Flavobacterium sp.]|uniref:glycosyltransferase n=1 Tax=Flavobacterium sp. TaxID=239 RepID=UPI002B4B819C|nr:glycosyltransferase [Flavobacterium sp.]HLP63535.1 glycosyltransferase [Flavobacterium sp.]
MSKNILVAPLNWGLGHTTRCIPIIKALEENGFAPILASDGSALALLKKEFPHLTALELPSYQIEYAKKGENFKWKLIKNSPKTINAILEEKKMVKKWVKEYDLCGIISDNRLGVRNKKVPSVFITHQLTVLSGKTTWISSKLHQFFIAKFNECWVPDTKDFPNLSGKLGHLSETNLNIKYIGILSRLQKKELPIQYQLMVILSGPEPQRTLLEEKLIEELKQYNEKVVFIKGRVEAEQKMEQKGNITFYNFMQTEQLEKTFNESEIVLCRSGYTTVMDLAKLEKKAFFIPTPGQFEQEYLAKKYKREGLIPTARQDKFKMDDLNEVIVYKGLPKFTSDANWKNLFLLFESE